MFRRVRWAVRLFELSVKTLTAPKIPSELRDPWSDLRNLNPASRPIKFPQLEDNQRHL